MIYDINANPLVADSAKDRFREMLKVTYDRDETSGAFYTLINIPQVNMKGEKQYPFVIWPNYPNGGTESAYTINQRKNYEVIINSGRYSSPYGAGVTLTGIPKGTVIENGIVLQQGDSNNSNPTMDWVLTISNTGELGYARYNDSAQTLVSNGIVSAVSGFIPILSNYTNIDDIESEDIDYIDTTADTQHQVVGQYGNGDYAVLTTEGRSYQGGGYMTMRQLQSFCKSVGMKFAFSLDGGGSTETVVGKRQLNPFYDNTYGRNNPTFIVFNGSTQFADIA